MRVSQAVESVEAICTKVNKGRGVEFEQETGFARFIQITKDLQHWYLFILN